MKKAICILLAWIMMWSVPAFAEETLFVDETDGESIIVDDDFETDEYDEYGEYDEEFFEGQDDGDWDSSEAEEQILTPYDYNHITIGNPTPMDGKFFTDMFGNATSDVDVRLLLNDYSPVLWDSEISMFRLNHSVVSGGAFTNDASGDRNYLLVLYNDLFYSDGTPITAYDYAFSVLLQCDPAIREIGGHPYLFDYLVGYDEYLDGTNPYLAGLRVISDQMLQLTVKSTALPYFYEMARLNIYPYPISTIAPGYAVMDTGKGAYLADENNGYEQTMLSADVLRETVLNPETGYLIHPSPVSGPYCLESFDGVTAEFEINPYYKGNEEGIKPRIQHLTYTIADNNTMIDELAEGKFALLNKVLQSDTILKGFELLGERGQYTQSAYPRIGLTYIYFSPESEAVQEQAVRQAIASCLNKPDFISMSVDSFGLETDGLMGLGQWMYQLATGTIVYEPQAPNYLTPEEEAEYNRKLREMEEISLDSLHHYDFDTEAAAALLDAAGWTLNEQGETYQAGTDNIRCKMMGDHLVKLSLTLGYPVSDKTEAALRDNLQANLAEAGIGLTLIPVELPELIEIHNEHSSKRMDMLYLGDNFNISFDPSWFFPSTNGNANEALSEEALEALKEMDVSMSLPLTNNLMHALAADMARTEPYDVPGYMLKWIDFEQRLSDLLPILPVYINIYFDFYTRELHNYLIQSNIAWSTAIVPARMYGLREIEMETQAFNPDEKVDILSFFDQKGQGKEAVDYSRGALSLFPEEVRSQIPSEFKTINEFVTSTLKADELEKIESITMKFTFQSVYPPDTTVYLLFGLTENGITDWYVQEAYTLDDGAVSVTLQHELLEKLNNNTYALAVVSE